MSLYSDDMTKEEVMKEAARILAPTLRRMYFERFGNEAGEKDENKEKFLGEAADLLFHYLVLLQAKGHSLKEVTRTLEARHK